MKRVVYVLSAIFALVVGLNFFTAPVSAEVYTPEEGTFYNAADLSQYTPTLKNEKSGVISNAVLEMTVPVIPGTEDPSVVAVPSEDFTAGEVVKDGESYTQTFTLAKTLDAGAELKGEDVFTSLTAASTFTADEIKALFDAQPENKLTIVYKTTGDLEIESAADAEIPTDATVVGPEAQAAEANNLLPKTGTTIAIIAAAIALIALSYIALKKRNHVGVARTLSVLVAAAALCAATGIAQAQDTYTNEENFNITIDNTCLTLTLNANGGTYAEGATTKEIQAAYNGDIAKEDIAEPASPSKIEQFNGWYTDATAKIKADIKLQNITEDQTVYAGWKQDVYFLAPSVLSWDGTAFKTNTQGTDCKVNPDKHVIKTEHEVQEDIKKINAGDQATIDLYEGYMSNDDVHLYSKLTYEAPDEAQKADEWFEARIIQVGPHDYIPFEDGAAQTETNDKTALTFMATNVLPEASAMGGTVDTYKNILIWTNGEPADPAKSPSSSELFQKLNDPSREQGSTDVGRLFTEGFVGALLPTSKTSFGFQGAVTDKGYTVSQKLWLPSVAELGGTPTWAEGKYANEGTQYKYFADQKVGTAGGNSLFASTAPHDDQPGSGIGYTRSGQQASGAVAGGSLWERTADDGSAGRFSYVDPNGALGTTGDASSSIGLPPCFAL